MENSSRAVLCHNILPFSFLFTQYKVYECLLQLTRFSIRYYVIAVLFVVFDVETIFLFPWAVSFDRLAVFGFVEMMIFLAILLVGYVYAWKRGALEWA